MKVVPPINRSKSALLEHRGTPGTPVQSAARLSPCGPAPPRQAVCTTWSLTPPRQTTLGWWRGWWRWLTLPTTQPRCTGGSRGLVSLALMIKAAGAGGPRLRQWCAMAAAAVATGAGAATGSCCLLHVISRAAHAWLSLHLGQAAVAAPHCAHALPRQVQQRLMTHQAVGPPLTQWVTRFSRLRRPIDGSGSIKEVLAAATDSAAGVMRAKVG